MHAEILAIGDEITSGLRLDTNSRWLSQRLGEMGVRALYHSTVADDLDACAAVFRNAVERADVIISTGGLGPTADDLTREAIARAADRELVLNQKALAHVRSLFHRRKRVMPQSNERQALFPQGSRVIDNPNGTAPGVDLTVERGEHGPCRIFALPGVPAEMKEMWEHSVAEAVRRFGGPDHVIRHRVLACFGAGESQIEAMLPDLIRRGRKPSVGINASKTTILLRITAEGQTEQEANAAIEPTVRTIRRHLGDLVFGEGDDRLQDAVARLLRKARKTLATAEWGTAGLVTDWMGETPESEGHYLGGFVAQQDGALVRTLGVPSELLQKHTAVSREAAQAMATGCRRRFGADYGLAVARFPTFDPHTREPASVYFALAAPQGVTVEAYPYAGHPAMLKNLCAKTALNLVRLTLLKG